MLFTHSWTLYSSSDAECRISAAPNSKAVLLAIREQAVWLYNLMWHIIIWILVDLNFVQRGKSVAESQAHLIINNCRALPGQDCTRIFYFIAETSVESEDTVCKNPDTLSTLSLKHQCYVIFREIGPCNFTSHARNSWQPRGTSRLLAVLWLAVQRQISTLVITALREDVILCESEVRASKRTGEAPAGVTISSSAN